MDKKNSISAGQLACLCFAAHSSAVLTGTQLQGAGNPQGLLLAAPFSLILSVLSLLPVLLLRTRHESMSVLDCARFRFSNAGRSEERRRFLRALRSLFFIYSFAGRCALQHLRLLHPAAAGTALPACFCRRGNRLLRCISWAGGSCARLRIYSGGNCGGAYISLLCADPSP